MKPVLVALRTPDTETENPSEVGDDREGQTARAPRPQPAARPHPARARIIDDARRGARAYVVSFVIPADGE